MCQQDIMQNEIFIPITSLQSLAVYMVRPAYYSQLPEAHIFNWNINLIHSLIEFITWRLLNRSKNLRRVTTMSHLSCCKVYQHVIQMSVSQTNNVPNHGHDRRRPSITLRHLPPLCCTGAGTPQLSEKVPKMSHVINVWMRKLCWNLYNFAISKIFTLSYGDHREQVPTSTTFIKSWYALQRDAGIGPSEWKTRSKPLGSSR